MKFKLLILLVFISTFMTINAAYAETDFWSSNSLVTSGISGVDVGGDAAPNVIYNLFGDEKWHMIVGEDDGGFYSYGWNGTSWVTNTSVKSGLQSVLSMSAPHTFYNLSGDGKWHIIIGRWDGNFTGYKWNGSSWIDNSTVISGINQTDSRGSASTIYNLFGDEKWHLVVGSTSSTYDAYRWNGTGWDSNSSVISGLVSIGSARSAPQAVYNFTGENKWHLIIGGHIRMTGHEWNGSTWTVDNSVVSTYGDVQIDIGEYHTPTVFYDLFNDEKWHMIIGERYGYFNDGFEWGTDTSGPIHSNNSVNTTEYGISCAFNVTVDDDFALNDNGQYIFATNNTGMWVNESAINFTSTPETITTIKTLNSTPGNVIGYRWYSTDNYGNVNNTPIYTLQTDYLTVIPPDPINLTNITGNFWVNHTYEAGSGNVTDSYNVSVNGIWYNTTFLHFNDTYTAHGWQNITVYAYNISAGGTLSSGNISQNTQIPNNNITITNGSDWSGSTGDNIYVDFDSTDLDSDTPTFSCNRTDLFTDFNTSTGQGNCTAIDGLQYINFGVSDGHGSIDNYTMTIRGNMMPADPENLANYSENLWVNHSWSSGGDWYLLVGEDVGDFYGYKWNGSGWQTDSVIESGFGSIGSRPAPEMFYMNDTLYMIIGNHAGEFYGYNWTGTTWQVDSAIRNGLIDYGRDSRPAVFQKDGTWYLILAYSHGIWNGYNWTGTIWQNDSAIINGIVSSGDTQAPEVFQMGNDWYFIAGQNDGTSLGFKWNGTGWNSDSAIVSGITDVGQLTNPSVFQMNGIWYNIAGTYEGPLYGFNWTGTIWQSDSTIKGDIGDLGEATSTGNIFISSGNVTDAYNVSVNGMWYNGTNTSHNDIYSPHTWSNITVYSYNSSGSGTLSANSISQNTQVANSVVTITNTSDWSGNYSENVYVDFDSTDLDGDTPTFSCSRTDLFTDFNTITGQGNWTAVGGTYSVDFGVSDGWGSADNYTMEITVTEPFVPPDPFNIANSIDGLWINHTWEKLSSAGSSQWYILDGDLNGGLYGFNWSGTTWQSDSTITGGLPSFGPRAASTSFTKSGITYLLAGNESSYLSGYNWTGSEWQNDNEISNGLNSLTTLAKKPFAFEMDNTWYLIIPRVTGGLIAFDWTGSTWQSNTAILSGLPTFIVNPSLTAFEMEGTWYILFGRVDELSGHRWTGSTWTSDTGIAAGCPSDLASPSPRAFQRDGTWYLIIGNKSGAEYGFNWTGSAWQSDNATADGLGTTGNDHRSLNIFVIEEAATNITDSYNVSVNGVWYNGSSNQYYNDTYVAHSWQNITIYAYNSSIYGALSENSISQNTQVSNNPITISDVLASYAINEGETFMLDANYTDLDNDVATFTDNSSDWNINPSTGEVSWLTTSADVGTHYYRVTVDDGYGSTDYADFTLTINETLEVLSTDPTGDFDLDTSGAQELSAELNLNATVIWYVDSIESQTEYNTTTPDYYFTSLEAGEFNVTFVATDPISGTSDSFTWIITVTDIVTPSVYAPPPRIDSPVVETVDEYVTEFLDEYEYVTDATTEIIEETVSFFGVSVIKPVSTLIEEVITHLSTTFNWLLPVFVYLSTLVGRAVNKIEDVISLVVDTVLYGTIALIVILLLSFIGLAFIFSNELIAVIIFVVVGFGFGIAPEFLKSEDTPKGMK